MVDRSDCCRGVLVLFTILLSVFYFCFCLCFLLMDLDPCWQSACHYAVVRVEPSRLFVMMLLFFFADRLDYYAVLLLCHNYRPAHAFVWAHAWRFPASLDQYHFHCAFAFFFSSEHLYYLRGLLPAAIPIYDHLRVLVLLVLLYPKSCLSRPSSPPFHALRCWAESSNG